MKTLRKTLTKIQQPYANDLPKIASLLHDCYDMHNGIAIEQLFGSNAILSAFVPSLDELEPDYEPRTGRSFVTFDEIFLITPFVTLRLDGRVSFRQYSEWEECHGVLRRFDYVDEIRLEIDGFNDYKTDFNEYTATFNRLKNHE
jgi:hypothetical protein